MAGLTFLHIKHLVRCEILFGLAEKLKGIVYTKWFVGIKK